MSEKPLDSLRAAKRNPRKITPKRLAMLRKAMKEYGDLGGIVRAADGTLVGGHQRVEAYRNDKSAKVVVTERYERATPAGTVAEGYVVIGGERFAYRETNWSRDKAEAASISANKAAGDWDMTALTAIINDLAEADADLELTMFDEEELLAYLPDAGDLADAPEPGEPETEAEAGQRPETPAVGTVSAQPKDVPTSHVKMVQLFYREDDHRHFVQLTDALRDIYEKGNLSDTVMEALRRASVSAALK